MKTQFWTAQRWFWFLLSCACIVFGALLFLESMIPGGSLFRLGAGLCLMTFGAFGLPFSLR